MSQLEDKMKAMHFKHPEFIPVRVEILPATWKIFRDGLEKIVQNHPIIFGESAETERDYDNVGPGTYFDGEHTDIWGMLSPAMFERFVLPELALLGQEFGQLWYHLDGGNACQHVPQLLSLPSMKVIQYVPTPSEAPIGSEHLALYRQIQQAGIIVHIQTPVQLIEPLVKALDPGLLYIETRVDRAEDADVLLADACRWARA